MKKILPVLYLLALFSCQSASDEPLIIVDVEEEFQVSMKEILTEDEDNRKFTLELKTIEPVTCSESTINSDVQISNNQFVINIRGIDKPDNCDDAAVVIKKDLELGQLNEGIYNIQFILQDAVFNWGQIAVNELAYNISMQSQYGIEIAYDQLSKIPKNTIWGYATTNLDDDKVFDEFSTKLIDAGAQALNLNTGNYHYFKVYAGSTPEFDIEYEFNNSRRFIYTYNETNEVLERAMEEMYNAYPNANLKFRIFNSKGEIIE